MGNLTGVAGGGSLPEQIQFAGGSTVAGTVPDDTAAPVLSPVSKTATFNTGGIYRRGANVAMARLQNGAVTGAAIWTVKVQHSDDDGVADAYADATAGSQGVIPGAAVATAAGAVATANTDYNLVTDLRLLKKWIRYTWTLVSGTSSIVAQAVTLGAFDVLPATDN